MLTGQVDELVSVGGGRNVRLVGRDDGGESGYVRSGKKQRHQLRR